MRRRISVTLLFSILMSLAELARAENWLQGQILENHGDTKKPAVGAQIWIVNVGNPYMTQSDGGYRVLVPDAYRVGQTIVLFVKRKGWAIAVPVGGKVELSKEFTTDILLSPEASSEFLSSAQLDKLLESLPEKLKSQVKPDGKEGSADPAQVVKAYATEHGLPEGEVSAKIVELVKQYEQSGDLGKQCLAAIYRNDLKQAAARCEQNATSKVDLLKKKRQEVETLSKSHLRSDRPVEPSFVYVSGDVIRVTNSGTHFQHNTETRESPAPRFVVSPTGKPTPEQLNEAKRQLLKLTEEVVEEFKATGDTYYANYHFDKALQAYREGLSYVEKKDLPTLWADMQWLIGSANWQVGIRTKDAAIQEHLAEAANRFKEAQAVYTKPAFPEAWAAIENNLGAVLRNQGTRTGGEPGTQLLAQAVEAYKAALTVYTKEPLPQQWAGTQNNLGNVLRDQGTRTGGEASTQLLAQAVEAYKAALEIRTREHLPEDWAQTHNNLAKAALALEDWPIAAESYRNVLTLYPDYREAYQASNAVYHEKLFAYPSAFEVTKHWLDRHPEDVSAQANFAEVHLTTGRYGEAERRLDALLKKPDLDPNASVRLRIMDIVTALALKKADTVPQKLRDLRILVASQPETFHVDWGFDGTTHFVEAEQVFAPHRAWLIDLFTVVQSNDRAALLTTLDRVQANFKP